MITPIMIDHIGWGTYLFFAVINASFLPFMYALSPARETFVSILTVERYFYPETRRRSLEEIDFIFAKGYTENTSYVKAARGLPLLSPEEIEEHAVRYGFAPPSEKVTEEDRKNS